MLPPITVIGGRRGAGVCVTCGIAAAAAPVWRIVAVVVWVCICGGSRGGDLTTTRATPVWRRSSVGGGGGSSSKGCEHREH